MDYSNQSIVYPGSSFQKSHAPSATAAITNSFEHPSQYQQQQQFLSACPTASPVHHPFQPQQPFIQHQQNPYANGAIYSSPSINTTPVVSNNSNIIMYEPQHAQTAAAAPPPPLLMASSSSSTTTASSISSSSAEFLNEAFAKAASIPESFYPEFLQYSKETYEQSKGMATNAPGSARKKQKRTMNERSDKEQEEEEKSKQQQRKHCQENTEGNESEDNEDSNSIISHSSSNINNKPLSSSEIRRQIHIQSEQKRRAQIKDGFEELRNELPACLNKKMSKVALLHKTVQHIQHLKSTQMSILSELERLVHENEQLRKFQESVLQREALENLYTMSNSGL